MVSFKISVWFKILSYRYRTVRHENVMGILVPKAMGLQRAGAFVKWGHFLLLHLPNGKAFRELEKEENIFDLFLFGMGLLTCQDLRTHVSGTEIDDFNSWKPDDVCMCQWYKPYIVCEDDSIVCFCCSYGEPAPSATMVTTAASRHRPTCW